MRLLLALFFLAVACFFMGIDLAQRRHQAEPRPLPWFAFLGYLIAAAVQVAAYFDFFAPRP